MTDAGRNVEELTAAWQELEARAPVKLRAITSERRYKAMVAFMNKLLEEIGDYRYSFRH